MMTGPTHNRFQQYALVGEGAVGIVAHGIANQVSVACGVAEIVFVATLVQPRCLEEMVGILGLHGHVVLIENYYWPRLLCKL